MSENEIREPIQKRSIEKKERIIKSGFDLICKNGYYNTTTTEIAKNANVSIGILYQYFKDKHDILIAGIEKYACDIFYPMLNVATDEININKDNIENILRIMITRFIENHKLSQKAHEEIMAMTHSDKEVALFFQRYEIYMTDTISTIFIKNGFKKQDMSEKVHIAIHLIDDLCHEIVYHKHESINYDIMTDLVIKSIVSLIV